MNKKSRIILLLIFSVIIVGIAILNNRFNIIKKITKLGFQKEEVIRAIEFEPYSNNEKLTVLVTIEDNEYGIDNINYEDKDGKKINVKGNGKKKIAIDYKIEKDGEYKFIAYNKNGEKFEKNLIIDSANKENDTFGDLIDIKVLPIIDDGRTMATKANVSIDYKYGFGKNYYKIGNSDSWTTYNDSFEIDSYSILKDSLQDTDNNTVTIFAKKEDNSNNRVIISKQIADLDLDMPTAPSINITKVDEYATITEDGVKVHNEATVNFDSRSDITNYYSLDKGNTWIKYAENISNDFNRYIYAKSVKNNSGLENVVKKAVEPSADDAIKMAAYDGDSNTYHQIKEYIDIGNYINIDESVCNKKVNLQVYMMRGWSDREFVWANFVKKDNTESSLFWFGNFNEHWINGNYDIPADAKSLFFYSKHGHIRIYEIGISE